eukprot:TRINITY_DN11785_c0_g5_i1.p1 TRINITY_DN11785_c0_g5~~TRINITY_DN11785_c0_g5_i1.p1  ORF type:complete len:543 (-),score=93.40 TRINITY_DN11785_c0_g5_i1:235-1863(-)
MSKSEVSCRAAYSDDDNESRISLKSTFIHFSPPHQELRRTKSSPDLQMHSSPRSSFFQKDKEDVNKLPGHVHSIHKERYAHSSMSEEALGVKGVLLCDSLQSDSGISSSPGSESSAKLGRSNKGLVRALATIEELPQQLEEALQERLVASVTDIKGHCQELCDHIQATSDGKLASQLAVERIGRIPDQLMQTLSRSVGEMKDFVEARMENFVLNQSHPEATPRSSSSIVHEMSQIPTEVEEIARAVVDNAIDDSTHTAVALMDRALASLSHDSHMTAARSQVMASMPGANRARSMASVAVEVAKANVGDAIANVRGKPYSASDNKNVADLIMTSKVEDHERQHFVWKGSSELTGMQSTLPPPLPLTTQQQCNAGSRGHPEMCKKPCLFFPSGQCMHMSDCNFCHLPHPHRTNHLDKRNREFLAKLQVGPRVQIILQAMRSRASLVPFAFAANELVDVLESQCEYLLSDPGASLSTVRDQNSLKKVRCALQGQVLSSLISMFFKIANELEASPVAKMREAYAKFQHAAATAESPTMREVKLEK